MLFPFEILNLCTSISQYDKMLKYIVKAIHAFPKIYLSVEMSDFEAENENILASFMSIYDKIYEG